MFGLLPATQEDHGQHHRPGLFQPRDSGVDGFTSTTWLPETGLEGERAADGRRDPHPETQLLDRVVEQVDFVNVSLLVDGEQHEDTPSSSAALTSAVGLPKLLDSLEDGEAAVDGEVDTAGERLARRRPSQIAVCRDSSATAQSPTNSQIPVWVAEYALQSPRSLSQQQPIGSQPFRDPGAQLAGGQPVAQTDDAFGVASLFQRRVAESAESLPRQVQSLWSSTYQAGDSSSQPIGLPRTSFSDGDSKRRSSDTTSALSSRHFDQRTASMSSTVSPASPGAKSPTSSTLSLRSMPTPSLMGFDSDDSDEEDNERNPATAIQQRKAGPLAAPLTSNDVVVPSPSHSLHRGVTPSDGLSGDGVPTRTPVVEQRYVESSVMGAHGRDRETRGQGKRSGKGAARYDPTAERVERTKGRHGRSSHRKKRTTPS